MISSPQMASSSLSHMLAVSSRLITTELPLTPATREKRSLDGRAARTEPGLIRVRKDVEELCPTDDDPSIAVADGYDDLNGATAGMPGCGWDVS